MRDIFRLSRLGAVCIVLLFVAAVSGEVKAQSPSRNAPVNSASPEELSQAELVEAYRGMREQLRSAQTAIVNNRFEFESTARAQAATIAAKLDAMNVTLEAERRNRQAETDRFEFERERQQAAIQRSNQSVIWVASAFGAMGLLAMVSAALFQWRAINRMAQVIDQRPALPAPENYGLLPSVNSGEWGKPVAVSSQRLMSAIERMEQRINELEHTTTQPLPDASAPPTPHGKAQESLA